MHFKNTAGCRFLAILLIAIQPTFASDLPSAEELQQLGLEKRWRSQAVLDINRDAVSHVGNDENNFYVHSTGGVLTAFDAENGRKLWNAQVGRTDEPSMTMTSNKDIVLVLVGPMIYGFNKFTGNALLEHRLPKQPTAAPTMGERDLFVPMVGGAIYAYDLNVLKYKYRYGTLPDNAPRSFKWRFICNEEIITQPVLGSDFLAFATEAGNLISIEVSGLTPGRTKFQMVLPKPATAPLALAENETSSSIIMLTGDDQVFSVDLAQGDAEWVYPVGREMRAPVIIVNDDVYVVSEEGTLTRITRDDSNPLQHGRPVEIPSYVAPMKIGTALKDVELDADLQNRLKLPTNSAVEVLEVTPESPAAAAGIESGDLLVRVDDFSVTSVEEATNLINELPVRIERSIEVVRNGSIKKLKIRIPVERWDVRGVSGLVAVGRSNVYGTDQTNRLIAFDKRTAEIIGRVGISGFNFPFQNQITDQLYLVSSTGEVACLREIGPTVRLPDLGPISRSATVTSMDLKAGDGTETTGTVICEVELPDGTTKTVTTNTQGVVKQVYVQVGDVLNSGDPIVLIADDKFATYYRNPSQRPVDVEIADPFAVDSDDLQ